MLNRVRVKVSGKINLSLNITGKRDNMHLLDSGVASLDICDVITVRDRLDDKINLVFNSDFAVQNNTIIKAVDVLRKSFGPFGADIVVDKYLPLAGGMGGSSADAAGVIVALNRLFDFDKRGLNMQSACAEVGSDVYYMIKGGYARIRGTGEDVTFIDSCRELKIVYIYGGEALTSKVYSAYDALGGDSPTDNEKLINALCGTEKPKLGNMLFRAAAMINDRIKYNFDALDSIGLCPNMTGSGSTVYAISDDPIGDVAKLNERGKKANYAYTKKSGIEFE